MINVMSTFSDDRNIRELDNICDFILNKDVMNRLNNVVSNKNQLKYTCEDIIDCYLEEGIKNNIGMLYYIDSIIKDLEEEKNNKDDNDSKGIFKRPILDKKYVYSVIKEQTTWLIAIRNGNNEKLDNVSIDLLNKLELFEYKMNNLNEKDLNVFIHNLMLVDRKDCGLVAKLDFIFELLDALFEKEKNNSETKVK